MAHLVSVISIKVISVGETSKVFLVHYRIGNLNIMDLEKQHVKYKVKAHAKIVNAIDGVGGLNCGNGAPELVTAGRDGCIRVWDPR